MLHLVMAGTAGDLLHLTLLKLNGKKLLHQDIM